MVEIGQPSSKVDISAIRAKGRDWSTLLRLKFDLGQFRLKFEMGRLGLKVKMARPKLKVDPDQIG